MSETRNRARGRTLGMGEVTAVRDRASIAAPFGQALVEIANADRRIVGLSADLARYTDIQPFAEEFPSRFFNVGMSEQNLIAVAAGLAKTGWIPFATTYAVFASRRAYDFIAIACAHSHANVKIIAGLPGLTTGYGGTHQGIDDLALMCAVPGLVVIDPCDATEIMQATRAAAAYDGPVYMRLLRGNVPKVLDDASYTFRLGVAAELAAGADIGIVSTGLMTERALDAATALAAEGIAVGVLHVPCLKPLDKDAICRFAHKVKRLVTAENHIVTGGLGTMVVDTLYAAGICLPLRKVGIPDQFVECGSLPYLQEKYGLSTARLIETARAWAHQREVA
jgi:transketolase